MQAEHVPTPIEVLNQADKQVDFCLWAIAQLLPAAADSDNFYPLSGIYESLTTASDLMAEARARLRQDD